MTAPLSATVVVALAAEARPLIRHFGLERDRRSLPFAVYRNERLELIRSGVGAVAAAAAVGFGAALDTRERLPDEAPAPSRAWLNVGVAGGDELLPGVPAAVGEAALAARVEGHSGKVFYPPIVLDVSLPLALVHTVSRPELHYPEPGLYEMEAAGFIEAASRLSRRELVQVVKVVSDSSEAPVRELTAGAIEELVAGRCEAVAAVVDGLLGLAESLPRPETASWLRRILAERHFTVTQRRSLERLLERLVALGDEPRFVELAGLDASACLAALEAQLAAQPILLRPGKGRATS